MKDASIEFPGIVVFEDVIPWLTKVKLEGKDFKETYLSLAVHLRDALHTFDGQFWDDNTRGFFNNLAYCMEVWIKTINTIDGS
jgi:hypothetical protein